MPAYTSSKKYAKNKNVVTKYVIAAVLVLLMLIGGVAAVILVNSRRGTDARSQAAAAREFYFQVNDITPPSTTPPTTRKFEVVMFGNAAQPSAYINSYSVSLAAAGGTGVTPLPSPTSFPQPTSYPVPSSYPKPPIDPVPTSPTPTPAPKQSWLRSIQVQAQGFLPRPSYAPVPTRPPQTQVCTQQYDPVCGSDGRTYSNACYASLAKVSVMYKGVCKPTPPPTTKTCNSNADCPTGYYCAPGGSCPPGVKCFLPPRTCKLLPPSPSPTPTPAPTDKVVLNERGIIVRSTSSEVPVEVISLSSTNTLTLSMGGKITVPKYSIVGPKRIATIEVNVSQWANQAPTVVSGQSIKGFLLSLPGVEVELTRPTASPTPSGTPKVSALPSPSLAPTVAPTSYPSPPPPAPPTY